MDDKRSRKSKRLAIVKAAFWGLVLFGAVTWLVIESKPSLDVRFLVGMPLILVRTALGVNDAPPESFFCSRTLEVTINGLAGALFFAVCAMAWELFVKGDNEK